MNKSKTAQAILAIDHGSKFTGLAIASTVKIAVPLETLFGLSLNDTVLKIEQIINEKNVDLILVGQPLNLAGERSNQSLIVEDFASKLKARIKHPIILQPETDTTNWAKQAVELSGSDQKSAKRNGQIDALAAAKILQDYLDQNGFTIKT
jgi:putative Holliday junction resolvase